MDNENKAVSFTPPDRPVRLSCLTFGAICPQGKSTDCTGLPETDLFGTACPDGGAEVSAALAKYGVQSAVFDILTENPHSEVCLRELAKIGVDVSRAQYVPQKRESVFSAEGASEGTQRMAPEGTDLAVSAGGSGETDWDRIFDGITHFHISAVEALLTGPAAVLCLEGAKAACRRGRTVSLDLHFGEAFRPDHTGVCSSLPELLHSADFLMCDMSVLQRLLTPDLSGGPGPEVREKNDDAEACRKLTDRIMKLYPNLLMTAVTGTGTADDGRPVLCAYLNSGQQFYCSKKYVLHDIVDKAGAESCFAAGLIYGLNTYASMQLALEFATAASVLQLNVPGSLCRSDRMEVMKLLQGTCACCRNHG